jgi:hypothetical protein
MAPEQAWRAQLRPPNIEVWGRKGRTPATPPPQQRGAAKSFAQLRKIGYRRRSLRGKERKNAAPTPERR